VKIEKVEECYELLKDKYSSILKINKNFIDILTEAFFD
jgi:hypothetical protein